MSPAKSCPAGALARVEARASASGSGTGASARSRGTAPPSRSQRQRLSERDTQLLEIADPAQHRHVSLRSSQEPLAEQESRLAPARSELYRQWHQPGPHRKSWGRQDFLIQDRGLARLSVESARPVYH